MTATLQSRIQHARHAGFVGREAERDEFSALLEAESPRYNLVYVCGPAGIGKTSLLREYAFLARERGVPAFLLDLRDAEPSFEAVLQFVAAGSPFRYSGGDCSVGDDAPMRFVLLLDTCEVVGTDVTEAMLTCLLEALPPSSVIAAVGREPGGLALRTDEGWRAVSRLQQLGTLDSRESRELLEARHVPPDAHSDILRFAGGHPLALALVAEAFEQDPGYRFKPQASPDVSAVLLKRIVTQMSDTDQREALYALSLPPVTTEPLLAAMLDKADVYELFEWLRARTFVESTERGLQPHELVRNALVADLRWRNPALFETFHRRARHYYATHLARPDAQHSRLLADYLFLFRDNPLVRPMLSRLREQWAGQRLMKSESLSVDEREAVRSLVARHEGEEAAGHAAYWMERQPDAVHVYRDGAGGLTGCLFALRLDTKTLREATHDPAIAAAARCLDANTPLRTGEVAVHFRFWMSREQYHGLSPEQCVAFADTVRHYLTTPGLACSFLPCTNPEFWGGVFQFVGLQHFGAADFATDGRAFTVFGMDWREVPPVVWLEHVATLGLETTQPKPPPQDKTHTVLSREAFGEAVKEVLRHFTRRDALRHNPLIGTRLLSAHANPDAAVEALRESISGWLEAMERAPREARHGRALDVTYIHPAPTQERAAEQLDLPFSTYRRHLRAGVRALTETLWQREIAGERV